ncbi:hypothetical protein MMC29_003405 [Sticta canariensis]|nr:hypothetical protein [Sticta canariensis]
MKLLLPQQLRPLQKIRFQCRPTAIPRTSQTRPLATVQPPTTSLYELSTKLLNYIDKDSFIEKEKFTTLLTKTKPHRLHVYAKKHNTHITLTNSERQSIISVSAGNIGFRKSSRGSYDAGYQLGAYVMGRIKQRGLLNQIQSMELILRDFGQGREAIQKILLGTEGAFVRDRIVRVMDATRLKFGGVRGKKPRRLG